MSLRKKVIIIEFEFIIVFGPEEMVFLEGEDRDHEERYLYYIRNGSVSVAALASHTKLGVLTVETYLNCIKK